MAGGTSSPTEHCSEMWRMATPSSCIEMTVITNGHTMQLFLFVPIEVSRMFYYLIIMLTAKNMSSKIPKAVHGQKLFSIDTEDATHEGIKTIRSYKDCEFSTASALCVCVVTWNMNGKISIQDLVELAGADRNYDLLVVGLQEVPKMDVAQVLQSALADTHSLLCEASMQSLQLYLFGAINSESIREIKVDKKAIIGCGGLIGRKKGAVAIYINFSGIRMVFICCHLSAHANKVEKRNSQCRHFSHSLFSKEQYEFAGPSHVTVWLGDLNYRIQGITTMPARSLINRNLYSTIVSKDQLLREAERGEVFNGYCEGILSFKPTYKYDVGSSKYDTSHKIRVPSWTDRILFKVEQNSGIDADLNSYEAIDHITSSDHKPVRAHLCLRTDSLIQE